MYIYIYMYSILKISQDRFEAALHPAGERSASNPSALESRFEHWRYGGLPRIGDPNIVPEIVGSLF